ncbi:hypothetical protein BDZ89DRAFT_1074925 [Hymenopellis radicata]|nr:hypothetical protein BDZ89DRAFT_1074925 [Hymenopellis radicata]
MSSQVPADRPRQAEIQAVVVEIRAFQRTLDITTHASVYAQLNDCIAGANAALTKSTLASVQDYFQRLKASVAPIGTTTSAAPPSGLEHGVAEDKYKHQYVEQGAHVQTYASKHFMGQSDPKSLASAPWQAKRTKEQQSSAQPNYQYAQQMSGQATTFHPSGLQPYGTHYPQGVTPPYPVDAHAAAPGQGTIAGQYYLPSQGSAFHPAYGVAATYGQGGTQASPYGPGAPLSQGHMVQGQLPGAMHPGGGHTTSGSHTRHGSVASTTSSMQSDWTQDQYPAYYGSEQSGQPDQGVPYYRRA